MQAVTKGKKLNPPPDYEVIIEGVPAERYVVKWTVEGPPLAEAYRKHYEALQRVGQLFDKYGPDLEVEIHLNRVNPPPSILYNGHRLREWNREGRQPIRK